MIIRLLQTSSMPIGGVSKRKQTSGALNVAACLASKTLTSQLVQDEGVSKKILPIVQNAVIAAANFHQMVR